MFRAGIIGAGRPWRTEGATGMGMTNRHALGFVVVANADEHSRNVMVNKGLIANSRRTAMLIYRPYHLCGAETAMSILCAGLLGIPTGSSEVLPRVDIDVRAARDFRDGEVIGPPRNSGWNRDLRASLIPAVPVADDNPLPFFMLEGNSLARDVPEGTVITRNMVIPSQGSILWSLRERQDDHFLTEGGISQ